MSRRNKQYLNKRTGAQPQRANLAAQTSSLKEKEKRFLPFVKKAISVAQQDIATWKRAQALKQSEDPRSWQLQLLYDEIKNDALLTSQINNREQQSISMEFGLYKPNGEKDEEQTKILKKHPIYRFFNKEVLDADYVGDSLIELSFKPDLNGKLVLEGQSLPRANFEASTGLWFPDYNDDKNIKYREMAEYGIYILEFNSGGLGLVNKAVSHVLFRRFAQSCWAELCEIFGIPPRVMKTNTQDTVMLNRAEQMMSDMGAASWFIIDDTESFEFAKGVATSGEVYENLIKLCGNEISMLISGAVIGQDTKNGNRSKEESNQEVLWYLVQDDMSKLEQAWNNTIIPALVKHGILKGELTFAFDEAEDLEQLWNMTKEAMQYYDIDPKYLQEKFGIQATGKRESKTKDDEKSLQTLFRLFLNASAGKTGATMKKMAKSCCSGTHINLALPKNDFDNDALVKRFWEAGGNLTFDVALFAFTAQVLTKGLKKGWDGKKGEQLSNIGFVYGADDPALLTAYEMNLFRFAAGKTLAEAKKLNDIFKKSTSFDEFLIAAKQVTKVFNEEFLQTEYQTALLTGEAAATFSRLMAQSETFPYWEYKTVGDDKVRAEHRELEGLILPFNDPIWKILFPPNGWNCRCYVVARMKHEVQQVNFAEMRARAAEYMGSLEFKTAKAQGWGVNRAESGEVFTANQQYVNKFPGKASKDLEAVSAADYNLKSYSNAKKVAKEELPKYSGDAKEFLDSLERLDDTQIVRDYNNRPIVVTAKGYKTHTTGKRAYRVEYLNGMKATISEPDEVWINNYQGEAFEDMISLKYFKDVTLIVVTKILNGKVTTLSTWFPLAERKDVISKYRRGLLIHSK